MKKQCLAERLLLFYLTSIFRQKSKNHKLKVPNRIIFVQIVTSLPNINKEAKLKHRHMHAYIQFRGGISGGVQVGGFMGGSKQPNLYKPCLNNQLICINCNLFTNKLKTTHLTYSFQRVKPVEHMAVPEILGALGENPE